MRPTMPGVGSAPSGVYLDTAEKIRLLAGVIGTVVRDRAMPPSNATRMTDAERALVVRWAGK